jgi:hypothetical protein
VAVLTHLDARWSQEFANGYWVIYCKECDSTCSCSIEELPPYLWGDDDDEDDDADSENSPGVEVEQAQEPFIETVKASPGVGIDPVEDQLPECVECFDDGFLEEESGFIKVCQCRSETKLSRQSVQSAIVPAAKISLDAESDQNPILTGITLSDRFVARYAPPQAERHYKVVADGEYNV